MGSQGHSLHILFFPLIAPGHMIPMVDMAKLFASRDVKATIVTTPGNAPAIRSSLGNTNDDISLHLIPLPSVEGLPQGCENLASLPQDSHPIIVSAIQKLRPAFENALKNLLPDCLVSDMFMPWTADVAAENGTPRIVFHGSNFFASCVTHSIEHHGVLQSLQPEQESFVVPQLPHQIVLRRSTMFDYSKLDPAVLELFRQMKVVESKNYGTLVNTFYELEPGYADYTRNAMGQKAWAVGPLSLCNKDAVDKSRRGNPASIDHDVCLRWLDSKPPSSVVYVCFGSMTDFAPAQLREIALGLETINSPFIWVVRGEISEEWMPQGFEERTKGKGLIIRGWAPQILILNHGSVGGFVTHCGWNSSLEGISAGVPFVTWPIFAEQFYNERLIVDVLKIGVAVGITYHAAKVAQREIVEAARIERAIDKLMDAGDEVEERRRRARDLGQLARRAVEKDGSSDNDMNKLIAELLERRSTDICMGK